MAKGDPLLEVEHLVKYFPIKEGLVIDREVAAVHAVDDVSLTLHEGETLGLVGESGCGKSTLCRAIMQLITPTSGSVRFEGQELVGRSRKDLQPLRRQMQMIFQDPFASLNPRKRVGQIVGDPLKLHGLASGRELRRDVQELLERVGLSAEHYNRFPHEFSGGQRQRIGIARALALRPKLIIADEPVSALDVSIQAQIIHPYSLALLSAVPIPDPKANAEREPVVLEGDVPSPVDPPPACRFHTRCPWATEICSEDEPPLADYGDGQAAACHHPRNVDAKEIAAAQLAPDSPASASDTLPAETERVPAGTR